MSFFHPLLSETRDSSSRKAPAGAFSPQRWAPRRAPLELYGREDSSVFARTSLPRGVAEFDRASGATRVLAAAAQR
ncbi:MAG TPA: hypothetical protein VGF76_03645 [Polyangiaceae bacterium]|jgi:hypothetical protein